MLSITLRQIEYATSIATHGGVTAAAQALHISQPALSVALAQLEALLGQSLFLRRAGGRLIPTSFGHHWLARASQTLADVTTLATPATLPQAEIRLAIFEDLAPTLLAPLLRLTQAPAIALRPALMGFEALTAALTEARCDLALTWDLGLPPEITRQTLARIAPHAVLSSTHPLASCTSLSLTDLVNQPLVLADQDLSLGHIRQLFAREGLTPTIAHRTATLELMRSFAANGLGVGLSYTNPASRHSHDGATLITRPLLGAGTEAVVLAHLSGNPQGIAMKTLAQLLQGLLASQPDAGESHSGQM